MTGEDNENEDESAGASGQGPLDQGQLVLAEATAVVAAVGGRGRVGSTGGGAMGNNKSLPYEGANATSKTLTPTPVTASGKDDKVGMFLPHTTTNLYYY